MDQYDDDSARARVLPNSQVLAFVASYWVRRRALLAATLCLTLTALAFELMVPRATGALMNALVDPRHRPQVAWRAWGVFVGVYLAFQVIRNLSFRFWNPVAAATWTR